MILEVVLILLKVNGFLKIIKYKNKKKMLTEQQLDQIDGIMDNFDFHKVYKVMKYLNWAWFDYKTKEYYIPDEGTIRKHARNLLKELFEKSLYSIATGGFYAEKIEDCISLKFVLTSWEELNSEYYDTLENLGG